jgi:hypothetical protein
MTISVLIVCLAQCGRSESGGSQTRVDLIWRNKQDSSLLRKKYQHYCLGCMVMSNNREEISDPARLFVSISEGVGKAFQIVRCEALVE